MVIGGDYSEMDMTDFSPYTHCAGCGKKEIVQEIESTSGFYGQCTECLKKYNKSGFIQANYFCEHLKRMVMICESQINKN